MPLLQSTPGYQYPVIRTHPSLAARLENVLTSVLAKLDSTSNSLNALLGPENQAAFQSTLTDIARVAHTLAERNESIDAGLKDAARVMKNSASASHELAPLIARIGRAADAVEKMGNEIAGTSASAGKTLNAVGSDINRFTAETLPQLERLLGELSVLTTSLRRLSEQTERNPSGLLFGHKPVPDGPGESSEGGQQP